MNPYFAGHFSSLAETEFGRNLWGFLNERNHVAMMEEATAKGRPAVEPLERLLIAAFGAKIAEDRAKQMAGHMVRQIMEAIGYEHEKYGEQINGELFTCASTYKKKL